MLKIMIWDKVLSFKITAIIRLLSTYFQFSKKYIFILTLRAYIIIKILFWIIFMTRAYSRQIYRTIQMHKVLIQFWFLVIQSSSFFQQNPKCNMGIRNPVRVVKSQLWNIFPTFWKSGNPYHQYVRHLKSNFLNWQECEGKTIWYTYSNCTSLN
jgi:hypothetical protein